MRAGEKGLSLAWERRPKTYVLNFGHPLHASVLAELSPATEVRVRFNLDLDGATNVPGQVADAVDDAASMMAAKGADLDGTAPVVVALPGVTEGAALLVAELHGRLGTFPRVLQLRNRGDGTWRLAGVVELERVRLEARGRR